MNVQGQTELTPEMIARRKAAQEVAIRIAREGMQTMPRPPPGAIVQTGSSAPPFMDNAAVLAAAQAAAMKIAQEVGRLNLPASCAHVAILTYLHDCRCIERSTQIKLP